MSGRGDQGDSVPSLGRAQRASPRALSARALFAGALIVALCEAVYVLAFSAASFDGIAERVRFVAAELALFAPLGALAGLAALAIAEVPPKRRPWLLAGLAAPACAYVGWAAFAGPTAQKLPAHQLWSMVIAAVGVVGVYAVAARLEIVVKWGRSPHARRIFAALVLVVAALVAADARVLPRLYAFFHRGLELIALAVAAAAAAVVLRPRARRAWTATVLVVAALAGVAVAATILRHAPVLATVLGDRATAGSVIAHHYPRPTRKPAPIAAPDELDRSRGLPPGPRLSTRDVVLVTIDAWRADRMNDQLTPNLTALAARGVRFADAYTQVPHTSFAIATLLTGKYVRALSALGLDAASHETLPQVFRRERFKTAGFYPPAVFFIDHDRLEPLERSAYGFEYVKYEYMDAQKRTDQVVDFFEHEQPSRAFVWVHYFEPHEPYEVHPGYTAGTPGAPPAPASRTAAEVRYEGEIRYVDAAIARLVDYLRRERPGALVVLAADHGEEFGEHGGRYHGTTLFDEQVRVPLVFAPVSGPPLGPRVIRGPVGLVDVAPTILSLLGVTTSAKMRGRDLSPWMRTDGDPPPSSRLGPEFAEIDRKKMVVDGTQKLVCDLDTGGCALYDGARDPEERRDASEAEPEVLAHLRGLLDRFLVGESRFERRTAAPPGLEATFERARLGDAAVAPRLAAALATAAPETRAEILRMLVDLPASPDTRPALASLQVGPDENLFLDLLRARLGDATAKTALRTTLLAEMARPRESTISGELFARAALATGDVSLLCEAVDRTDERELVIALAHALAASRDPRALDALLIALAPVRSRADVVDAIRALGDKRAVPTLARWLGSDPYVPVRAAMVRAIAALDSAAGRDALVGQLAIEHEGPVLDALVEALPFGRYGKIELKVPKQYRFILGDDNEMLIVARGPGAIRFFEQRLPISDGVVRITESGCVLWPRDVDVRAIIVRPIPPSEDAPRP